MGVQAISLVTVQVRDFDAMVAWYRDVLGLSVVWREPNEFCTLSAPGGGAVIALATDHPDRISPNPRTGWTPTFSVDDFDATVASLRAAGVAFDAEEEGSEEAYRLVRIEDPEGNVIGISA
jgi:catechol 2,3-dioxygenase-like lactoylglutathione lyase family enzyme